MEKNPRIQILPRVFFFCHADTQRTALRCACAPLFAGSWPAFAFIVICELTASAGPILEQDN